jgi:hypothetical protein
MATIRSRRIAFFCALFTLAAFIGITVHFVKSKPEEEDFSNSCDNCSDITTQNRSAIIVLLISLPIQVGCLLSIMLNSINNANKQAFMLVSIVAYLSPFMVCILIQLSKLKLSGTYMFQTSLQFYPFFIGSLGMLIGGLCIVSLLSACCYFTCITACIECVKDSGLYYSRIRELFDSDYRQAQLNKRYEIVEMVPQGSDAECSICKEMFVVEGDNEKKVLITLPCKHPFHKACIDQWLENHETCPLCRANQPQVV